MMKLIISNQLEMKFQKFSDGLKLLTVNGVVTKDKTEFNIDMSTISMRAADDAYVANHPRLIDDLKNYLQSNGANAGNRDQLTRQYCMETYLPNSIKKVSPSVAKTDETNIFKDCSVELTKKDDK